MIIGGFKVGDYRVRDEANKRYMLFDCRHCVFSANVADDKACRFHVMHTLKDIEADLVVLAEVYDRVYDEKQVDMLKEITSLIQKFDLESIWSLKHLGEAEDESAEGDLARRHNALVQISRDIIAYDPLRAYLMCLTEVKAEKRRFQGGSASYKKQAQPYLKTLLYIKGEFEKTQLIKSARKFLTGLEEIPETNEIYRAFFEAQIKPSFIGSRLMYGEEEELTLLDEYTVKNATVQVFSHPNKTQNLYHITAPEYTLSPEKYFVLTKAREVVAGYTPGKASLSLIAKSRQYFERVYRSTIIDIARKNNVKLSKKEVIELGEIVARYSVGYGILELLLSDRRLTDVYVDSPIGQNPIYGVHADFGSIQTNVLYTVREAETLVTKLRAMSGRPFDEAHPVLDFDLPDMETRIATIGPPLAPQGLAFAFRLHKLTPWTLPQFIDNDFVTPLGAGMLSFFIDNQATILVTGSRGSGKTSLMAALILEILKNTRVIVQEDTLELPVSYMKQIGFNIQSLKTQSAIGVSKTESEMSAEEALRTSLRLGDSAIVVGEVRSKEARTLYEAMRVGAAGNVVMGTIHGDSAYSVWDRVVNDLDVPSTSFKATDIIATARPIRFSGSVKRHRRLFQVTEVKKHWTKDPALEGGLLDLLLYDAGKDELELLEDNLKESYIFDKVSRTSGLNVNQIWDDIRMRAKTKEYLVELKRKHDLPLLLEGEYTARCNDKLMLMREHQLQEHGSIDFEKLYKEWSAWVRDSVVKRLLSKG